MDTAAEIYQDIASRTGGDIYIGVVGPVRTGKSTFIKRFMETMVIPRIEDVYARERAKDELPQSGSGRTIMTAEPKFVPENAVSIMLGDGAECSVRLVDCVGYMVPGAAGLTENGTERMVMTPWYDDEITMTRAAEEGTRRVINDHSSIGILITTDGSVCSLPREDYIPAEERAASELKRIGKPFIVLLNCAEPDTDESKALAAELSEKYGAACIPVNCLKIDEAGMTDILRAVLYEFPASGIYVYLPAWVNALAPDCEVRQSLCQALLNGAENVHCLRDVAGMVEAVSENDLTDSVTVRKLLPGTGQISVDITLPQGLYYKTVSEESGFEIRDDGDLMALLRSVSGLKSEYDRVHGALEQARQTGYGIVMPLPDEMHLEEPELVRQGSRYGVRLKASAPSVHMIMTNVETEVSPALGGEKASDEIMSFLLQGFDGDISRIWESNIFGKSLYDIAGESVAAKVGSLGAETQSKLRQTLQRIVNEGGGGLICIIL